MKLILVFVVAIAALQCQAKVMTVCELVHELRRLKFPETKLRDWVCLVDKESSFRTHVVGPPNSDGSRDHGLFQINDRYWCNPSNTPGKECKVTCAQLLTDDISVAASCAQKIFQIHGFSAWYGWVNGCSGKALPDISQC